MNKSILTLSCALGFLVASHSLQAKELSKVDEQCFENSSLKYEELQTCIGQFKLLVEDQQLIIKSLSYGDPQMISDKLNLGDPQMLNLGDPQMLNLGDPQMNYK